MDILRTHRTRKVAARTLWARLLCLALAVISLAACPPGGPDTRPPVFGGVTSAVALGMTRAVLGWAPATDETTPPEGIAYYIYTASSESGPFSEPVRITAAGELEQTLDGLAPYAQTWVVVRAVDGAGNEDGNVVALSVTTGAPVWDIVDGDGAAGIDDGDTVDALAVASAGGRLFVAWVETTGGGLTRRARAAVYGGDDTAPAWEAADAGPGAGLHHDPDANAEEDPGSISLAAYQDRLYAAWVEYSAAQGATQVRVAAHDPGGSGWTFVERATPDDRGINYASGHAVTQPRLVATGDDLYAVWLEDDDSYFAQVRVARYSGNDASPTWTFVDPLIAGINRDPYQDADVPGVAGSGGDLVVAWIENWQIRASGKDEQFWYDLEADGLNRDSGIAAYLPTLTVAGGDTYLLWMEDSLVGSVSQVRARRLEGGFGSPSWPFVDGDGDHGLNHDTARDATTPALGVYGEMPVALFREDNGTADQIRVRMYVSGSWEALDGGGTSGLNRDPAARAYYPVAAEHEGRLYVAWLEESSPGSNELRVARGW